MHEHEILLAVKAPSGVYIPTRDFDDVSAAAKALGPAYVEAVQVQVRRQTTAQGVVLA